LQQPIQQQANQKNIIYSLPKPLQSKKQQKASHSMQPRYHIAREEQEKLKTRRIKITKPLTQQTIAES
ncbi:hypothetical protein, partial [Metapseudomonas otitidis]|uniref:hypothetical protein n=1 Tax=Metapseudomonas otitidis TaxID=319939 RepID=UPI0013F65FD4